MKQQFLLLVGILMCVTTFAQELPQSKWWWLASDGFKTWTIESAAADPDVEFHVSRVPLKERFVFKASQANPNVDPNRKLGIWAGMSERSRGGNNAHEYCFTSWQYCDVFARWNGGGRRVTLPAASFTEAAHRNGTKVLGNIIWAWGDNSMHEHAELVRYENGVYVSARRLLDMAKFYGFDGWALNVESTQKVDKEPLVKFMQALLQYAEDDGIEDFKVLWYDARNNNGYISFTEQLTSNNDHYFQYQDKESSNVFFINYNWYTSRLNNSINRAEYLGRDPYDVYAGIYTNGSRSNYADLGHKKVSMCLWLESSGGKPSDTPLEFLNSARKATLKYWSGPNGDPHNPGTPQNDVDAAAGYSYFIADRSAIAEYPFFTRFNTGSGACFFKDGERVQKNQWSNVSLQDVLPTWQWWWSQGGNGLKVSINYEDAYDGASCLKIEGDASGENVLRLFKVKLPVSGNTKIALKYKLKNGVSGDQSGLDIGVAFESGNALSGFSFHSVGNLTESGWNSKEIALSQHSGQTMAVVALRVNGSFSNYDLSVGEVLITDGDVAAPEAPVNLTIENVEQEGNTISAKLKWGLNTAPRYNENANISYFDLYQVLASGEKQFVSRSVARANYVVNVEIVPDGENVTLEVVSVGLDGKTQSSQTETVTIPWNPSPVASFTLKGNTINDTLQLINNSQAAQSYEWTFEGGQPSVSTEQNPQVVFDTKGGHRITLKVSNDESVDSVAHNFLIVPSVENNTISAEFEASATNIVQGDNITFNHTGSLGKVYSPTNGIDVPYESKKDYSAVTTSCGGKPFTVSFWVRQDSWHKDWKVFLGIQNSFEFYWHDKQMKIRVKNVGSGAETIGTRTPNKVKYGEWTHFAVTFDNNELKMYENGELVTSSAHNKGFQTSAASGKFFVGESPWGQMNKVFDEIRFWNVARTEAEIKEWMFKELPTPYSSNLVHYWSANGDNNVVTDLAGSGNITLNECKRTVGCPFVMADQPVTPKSATYYWQFTGANIETSTEKSPYVRYNTPGTYPVSLTVTTSSDEATTTKTGFITVTPASNQAPVAIIAANNSGSVDDIFNFNGDQSSDPDGDGLTYLWNFGDGNTSTEISPAHVYDTAGEYAVTLMVTDTYGLTDEATHQVTIIENELPVVVNIEAGKVAATTQWQSVSLLNVYTSAIIVATPVTELGWTVAPYVVRIRNVTSSSFEIMLQQNGDGEVGTQNINYFVVESGTYTLAEHGIKMEANKVSSTSTAYKWNYSNKGEQVTCENTYENPVVLGQVMTYNDEDWSVFYSDNNSLAPPTSDAMYVGKHVGQGPDYTRENEDLGYIVFEANTEHSVNGYTLFANKGDNVTGLYRTPSGCNVTHPIENAEYAVACLTGMVGTDGAWAALVSDGALTDTELTLTCDEDQLYDSERKHLAEQVAYVVLASDNTDQLKSAKVVDMQNVNFKVWPNPVNNQLNIACENAFSYVILSSVTGAQLLKGSGCNEKAIDVGQLKAGVYLIKVSTNSEMIYRRFVKK